MSDELRQKLIFQLNVTRMSILTMERNAASLFAQAEQARKDAEALARMIDLDVPAVRGSRADA